LFPGFSIAWLGIRSFSVYICGGGWGEVISAARSQQPAARLYVQYSATSCDVIPHYCSHSYSIGCSSTCIAYSIIHIHLHSHYPRPFPFPFPFPFPLPHLTPLTTVHAIYYLLDRTWKACRADSVDQNASFTAPDSQSGHFSRRRAQCIAAVS